MDITLILLSVALTSVLLIIFLDFFSWIKYKFPHKVQCWFCHSKTSVNYADINSWMCPSCEQYNGFDKDGGYNKEIASQHEEHLNVCITSVGRKRSDWKIKNSALCKYCNYNQELKVKQLASFIPFNERKYDAEIKHYSMQLEESYKLCQKCEQVVEQVISSQKFTFSGPRRLVHNSKQLIFRSSLSLYLTMLLCVCEIASLLPGVGCVGLAQWIPKQIGVAAQPLAAGGVLLQTVQFCHFAALWAFVNWFIWVAMVAVPHLLIDQNPSHIVLIQIFICFCVFTSTLIILWRRKKILKLMKLKEDRRNERKKKEVLLSSWSTPSSNIRKIKQDDYKSDIRKRPPVMKPVARKNEDLDMSGLSIGSYSYSVNRQNPFSRVTWREADLGRCSSYSGRVSVTPPQSPRPTVWSTPLSESPRERWSPKECHWASKDSWSSPPKSADVLWSSAKSGWTPVVESSSAYPVYSTYPVTYFYSGHITKSTPPPPSVSPFISVPTLILAATNAALIYIIYTKEL